MRIPLARPLVRLYLAICTLSGVACYSDVPLRASTPPPRAELVLQLSDEGTSRLAGLLGRSVVAARGRLVSWTGDSVSLLMLATVSRTGEETLWKGEPAAIPRDAVAIIQERRLNAPRTAIVAAGAAAILFAAQQAMGNASNDGPGRGPPGPGQ